VSGIYTLKHLILHEVLVLVLVLKKVLLTSLSLRVYRTGAILELDAAAADDDDDDDDGRGRFLSDRRRLFSLARTHLCPTLRWLSRGPMHVSVTTSFDTRQHGPLCRQ